MYLMRDMGASLRYCEKRTVSLSAGSGLLSQELAPMMCTGGVWSSVVKKVGSGEKGKLTRRQPG